MPTLHYNVNDPDYAEIAVAGVDAILRTLRLNEKVKGQGHEAEWRQKDAAYHLLKAEDHLVLAAAEDITEPHIDHAITRLAMVLAKRET